MYLSILRLWNFRKYAGADNKPGLEIHFQKGVNVLIGENDSGKTAIVDAIRYVLRTQSGEFIQFEDKDFYQDSDGNRKDEFKINNHTCSIIFARHTTNRQDLRKNTNNKWRSCQILSFFF